MTSRRNLSLPSKATALSGVAGTLTGITFLDERPSFANFTHFDISSM
jgi:hypothetical protein